MRDQPRGADSRQLNATLSFYESLGFENRGAPPEEWDYLIVGREGIELHFIGPSAGPRGAGSCFLYVDDADALYAEWQTGAAASARIDPPTDEDYGMRSYTLFDRTRTTFAWGRLSDRLSSRLLREGMRPEARARPLPGSPDVDRNVGPSR